MERCTDIELKKEDIHTNKYTLTESIRRGWHIERVWFLTGVDTIAPRPIQRWTRFITHVLTGPLLNP